LSALLSLSWLSPALCRNPNRARQVWRPPRQRQRCRQGLVDSVHGFVQGCCRQGACCVRRSCYDSKRLPAGCAHPHAPQRVHAPHRVDSHRTAAAGSFPCPCLLGPLRFAHPTPYFPCVPARCSSGRKSSTRDAGWCRWGCLLGRGACHRQCWPRVLAFAGCVSCVASASSVPPPPVSACSSPRPPPHPTPPPLQSFSGVVPESPSDTLYCPALVRGCCALGAPCAPLWWHRRGGWGVGGGGGEHVNAAAHCV
jgi:hypothetical protein